MKAILKVDTQILKFFTKIAKYFNWLTGMDNFVLARLAIVIMMIFSFCIPLLKGWGWFVAFILMVPCTIFFLFTQFEERKTIWEQISGVKSNSRVFGRLFYLGLECFGLLLFMIGQTFQVYQWSCTLAWIYFCHVDQPPFKKSQAWQGLKNWLNGFSYQPQLELAPASMPNN